MADNLTAPVKSGIWKKRIPTLVGLLLLVVALVAGTFFFQDGLGVFSPRATPETTPKKVRVTNVSDSGFTISFVTEEATAGFVEYGTSKDKFNETHQPDERDKLSGKVGDFKTHNINVSGLEPNSTYYYVIGTGNGAKFDNEGSAFQITTARRATPSPAKTVYGTVTTESGAPADGAIVYIAIEGAGELSSLVKSSGSWAIPLSNARTTDKSTFLEITDTTSLQILVQGTEVGRTAQGSITVADAQPVPTLVFGQTEIVVADKKQVKEQMAAADEQTAAQEATSEADLAGNKNASGSAELATGDTNEATSAARLAAAERTLEVLVDASDSATTEIPVINSTQPIIAGQAVAGVVVDIEIHSDNKITQQLIANADGSFSLDIAALSQELEPGEHTVTYSYIDPSTGEKVTKTQTFIVEGETTTQLAQASTTTTTVTPTPTPRPTPSPTPYSSENPYPIGAATQSAQSSTSTTTSTSSASTISTSSGTRTSMPSTSSGVPVSGSVGTTFALIFGGLFFITSGAWSFWASKQFGH